MAITTTEFVSALVITNSCLKYIQALTTSLQAEARDVVSAVRVVDTVTATVQDVRDNIDTYARWFLTITVSSNHPWHEDVVDKSIVAADTPSEYFCRIISIPVLDHLKSDLRSPFGNHRRKALLGLSSLLVPLDSDDCISRVKALGD